MAERVIAYIDGFNLYFGPKSKGLRRFYWLDLHRFASNLLKPSQQLILVRYFTARISGSPKKERRQSTFLDANRFLGGCEMFFGHYIREERTCPKCQSRITAATEKMTDVNIAVWLLADAFADLFDTALLVSADSDLVPAVSKVRELFSEKRVVVAFPLGRYSRALENVATATFHIGRRKYAKSQLPDKITVEGGVVLHRPTDWR